MSFFTVKIWLIWFNWYSLFWSLPVGCIKIYHTVLKVSQLRDNLLLSHLTHLHPNLIIFHLCSLHVIIAIEGRIDISIHPIFIGSPYTSSGSTHISRKSLHAIFSLCGGSCTFWTTHLLSRGRLSYIIFWPLCVSSNAINQQSLANMNWNKLLHLCQSTQSTFRFSF